MYIVRVVYKGHLCESLVLQRGQSPNIPTLAFVDERVRKEVPYSGKQSLVINETEYQSSVPVVVRCL